MTPNRRDFLKTTAAAGGALTFGLGAPSPSLSQPVASAGARVIGASAPNPMKILILGGTNLTGPHNVRYAVERGHEVTIFTRGRRQPGLFQDSFEHVEKLIGDRENDLEALKGRTWDAVIDASGMEVAWTTASAELLRDSVDTYMYVSSTGVFYPYLTTDINEDVEPKLVDPSDGEDVAAWYGTMKALSEIEAHKVFGDERTCVVRPGYIVGPLDSTHRGTYWPERLHRGGDVLVPGKKTDLVQQIDVRDLTEWMIHLLEDGASGTYNATGPAGPTTLEEFVYGVRATSAAEVNWHWIEDYEFLKEHELYFAIPWILPEGDNLGSQRIDCSRAKATGLTFRPIATTAMDTLEWYQSLSDEQRNEPPMTISPEKEREVLDAWRARGG